MSKSRDKLKQPKPLPRLIGTRWAAAEACKRKRAFDLKVKADVWALHYLNQPKRKFRPAALRSYHCPICGKWHLTKKPQAE